VRNTEPTFIAIRKHWKANLSVEVFARGGGSLTSGAPLLLGAAGDYGAVVHDILITPTGTSIANSLRFFTLLPGETVLQPSIGFTIPAFNDSSQAAAAPYYLLSKQIHPQNTNFFPQLLMLADGRGLPLSPNESLYVGLGTAETTTTTRIHVSAFVGDYAAPT
jgi:hypothetical protein